MKKTNYFGLIFWIHLILIIIVYASIFLFNWKILILGVLVYYLQIIIFNGCILTKKQFGKNDYMTFYYPYLTKAGFNVNKKIVYYLMRWIMPIIILSFGLIIQLVFKFKPLMI
ncbi:MAG: hypothetical protein WC438_04055 [Candidatus Pacearchaeota archaeon]